MSSSSPQRPAAVCRQVHREDLLAKARRVCVLPPIDQPDEGSDQPWPLSRHLLKSLVDQAHLCPLPPTEAAVYWQYDHAMWLHPAPDVLIMADRQAQFQCEYEETLGINPGSFSTSFAWMVYRPHTKEVEISDFEG